MIDVQKDLRPLAEFRKNPGRMLGQMKRTGRPMVLTVNGKAKAVILDAAKYQSLMDAAYGYEQAEMDEFMARSFAAADRGQMRPLKDVLNELAPKRK